VADHRLAVPLKKHPRRAPLRLLIGFAPSFLLVRAAIIITLHAATVTASIEGIYLGDVTSTAQGINNSRILFLELHRTSSNPEESSQSEFDWFFLVFAFRLCRSFRRDEK